MHVYMYTYKHDTTRTYMGIIGNCNEAEEPKGEDSRQ